MVTREEEKVSNKPRDLTTKIRKNRNLKREGEAIRNPVAKNMNKFNKPATHKDKTKEELEELSQEDLALALHEYYHTGTDEV